MNLVIRIGDQPACVLLDCPTEMAETVKREFWDVIQAENESVEQSPICFLFRESPSLEPSQSLPGAIERIEDRYLGFDRNGSRYELPFGSERTFERTLVVSPTISVGFFVPNVILPLIHLWLMRRQRTLIHAAAVETEGAAIVLPAWGGAGKTSTLIELLRNHRCSFLADDLGVLTAEHRFYRFGHTINVLDYNLRAYPDLKRHFRPAARIAALTRSMLGTVRSAAARASPDSLIAGIAGRLTADAKALANARIPAGVVERDSRPQPTMGWPMRLVVMLERGATRAPETFPVSTGQASEVLAATLTQEFVKFHGAYQAYRSLVGSPSMPELDRIQDDTRKTIGTCLQGISIVGLRLPTRWEDYEAVANRIMELAHQLPHEGAS